MMILISTTSQAFIDSDQWQIHNINMEQGLPDPTVFSLHQDHNGFMWFGTTNGIARYDGYQIKVFKHKIDDVNSLSNNNAGNIFIDSQNTLWIGTFGGGLNTIELNTGQIKRYPYNDIKTDNTISANVQAFFEDSQSRMWIGTSNGLYHYENNQLNYHRNHAEQKNQQVSYRVWDIIEDSNKTIWIGTSEGLSQLNPITGVFQNFYLPEALLVDISSNQFRKLFMIDETIWIGSSTSLYSFNTVSQAFQSHTSNKKIKINDIFHMDEHHFLIGTNEGLYQFDFQSNRLIADGNNHWQILKHADIRNIFLDNAGLLWIATRDNGVIKIDQRGGLFQHHPNTLPTKNQKSTSVWSLNTDNKNLLYMGSSASLFRKNNKGSFESISSESHDHIPGIIRDIKPSKNNGIWIASSEGLYFLNEGDQFAKNILKPFELVNIKATDVFSVEESSNGTIWLTLYNLGILKWQPKIDQAELIQSYADGALTDLNLGRIFQDKDGYIWISSSIVGAFRYDIANDEMLLFKHDFNDKNSISSNKVTDIFQDSQQRIWITTTRGLNLFDPEKLSFHRYDQNDGLLAHGLETILEDSQKNLWLVYKFGISRFNPERNEINNYVLNNSIKNDGFITRAVTIDNNDVLYFGSTNGYYSFDPNKLQKSIAYEPKFMITGVMIDNESLSFEQLSSGINTINLSPEQKVISLEFAALEYKSTEQIKYSYRLAGLNDNWYDVTPHRRIELRNLNTGNYQIEIKAQNNDGRWDEQTIKVNLIKHPEWWSIGWVRILFVLTGILIATFIHYYRTYKIRQQYQKLEDEVKKRTSELLTLNQKLKKASQTDFLTGLYNRMGFIMALKKNHNTLIKNCIVMADIDHFKKVNDTFSHSAGDEVLKKVTSIMRSFLSEQDTLARWGGEEFIFHISNKDASQTHELIEKIRKSIEKTQFTYKNKTIPVTCTFGICLCCQNAKGLKDCIYSADEALYQGKTQGRNRTIISAQNNNHNVAVQQPSSVMK